MNGEKLRSKFKKKMVGPKSGFCISSMNKKQNNSNKTINSVK